MNRPSSICTERLACSLLLLVFGCLSGAGQVVQVTASLDQATIQVGESTTLRVFAQIVPEQQENTDRIFSWYVDLLQSANSSAAVGYDSLLKAASDNDSTTSSSGTDSGNDRTGIYDTFIGLPDAGRLSPVELFSVPVTATAAGQATFSVQAGTGVANLGSDFLVAPAGGGPALTGADYSGASVTLTVEESQPPSLAIMLDGGNLALTFTPRSGMDHYIETRTAVDSGTWTTLPNAPHNSGTLTAPNDAPTRFFRLRAEPTSQ